MPGAVAKVENATVAASDTRLPVAARWTLGSIFVTNIGNGMHQLAVGKLLFDNTGSVAAFGAVFIVEYIINFLVQLVAGPLADRHQQKSVIVLTDLARGSSVLLAALMIDRNESIYLCVFASVFVINIGKPFYRSATFTVGPSLASGRMLVRYNALYDALQQGGQLLGLALVGVLIKTYGLVLPFAVNGLSYVVAAIFVMLAGLPTITSNINVSTSWLRGIAGDWQEIILKLKATPAFAWHLIMTAMECNAVVLLELMIVPMVHHWQANDPYWLSIYSAGFGIGAIIGASFVGLVIYSLGTRTATWLGQAGQAVCFLILCAVRNPYLATGVIIIFGLLNTLSFTSFISTLQQRSKGPIKGRVVAARNFATGALAMALFPLVTYAQRSDTAYGLVAAGVIMGVFALATFILGSRRGYGPHFLGDQGG